MGISSASQAQQAQIERHDYPQYQQNFSAPSAPYYTEKKEPTAEVRPVSQYNEGETEEQPEEATWNPGFLKRFPWLGLGALLLVLVCLAGNCIILAVSNGRPQGDQTWKQMYHDGLAKGRWPKQIRPSVIISLLNSVAGLAFSLAIANGVAIAWWRKVLKGSTIQDLHKSWSFSSSVKAAALAGKGFNVIALAALVANLTIIDGILMQSATITEIVDDKPNTKATIQAWANTTFPVTATFSARSGNNAQVMDFLTDEVFTWEQSPRVLPYVGFKGCDNATCLTTIAAAGFEFDCGEAIETPLNLSQVLSPGRTADGYSIPKTESIFDISFEQTTEVSTQSDGTQVSAPALLMKISYLQAKDIGDSSADPSTYEGCPGTLYNQTCTLRPAVVDYPVVLENYEGERPFQQVKLATKDSQYGPVLDFDPARKQQSGFTVKNLVTLDPEFGIGAVQRLGGLYLAFNTYLGGHSNASYDGIAGYSQYPTGKAQSYVFQNFGGQKCGVVYNNPMKPDVSKRNVQSIVAMINEVMFAISMDVSEMNPDNKCVYADYPAVIYTESIHFKTRWLFMVGAIMSTVFCIICVLPTYWGYWQLGRNVSLGPFEIAHAFRSPMTAQAGNKPIDQVMDTVGHQKVQYGHIVSGDARGVLGVAEPEYVAGMPRSAKQDFREKILRRGATQ